MNWTCQYCGKDTKWVDSEYLVDTDHLQCILIEQLKNDKTNMPPKSLLDILDIQDNRITIKNLNKILTLSVKNKSMIQLFSAEEIEMFDIIMKDFSSTVNWSSFHSEWIFACKKVKLQNPSAIFF